MLIPTLQYRCPPASSNTLSTWQPAGDVGLVAGQLFRHKFLIARRLLRTQDRRWHDDGRVRKLLDGDGNGEQGGSHVFHFHRLQGDITGDLHVDQADRDLVNAALGGQPGRSNWDPNADVDRDLRITTRDRMTVYRPLNTMITPPDDLGDTSAMAATMSLTASSGIATVWNSTVGSSLYNTADVDWFRFNAEPVGPSKSRFRRPAKVSCPS